MMKNVLVAVSFALASQTAFAELLSVTAVSSGGEHICALISDGRVKCWGRNDVGQLGLGDSQNRGDEFEEMGDALQAVDLGGRATSISSGARHTCALLDDGRVKCWGGNEYGQLGLGIMGNRGDSAGEMGADLPAVNLGGRVIAVSAGSYHTCVLIIGGRVKCWGYNYFGQLGVGSSTDRGDDANEMGEALAFLDLGGQVTSISAGSLHTCALLDEGSVKCWGRNGDGELGIGDSFDRGIDPRQMGDALRPVDLGGQVISVSAGASHTCALLADDRVKCWGYNSSGQLGLGDRQHRGDNPGEMGEALPAVDVGGRVTSVSAREGSTCASLADGRVKCWGWTDSGRLGLGDTENRGDRLGEMGEALPALAFDLPAYRVAGSCALFINGGLKCWGDNTYGQLGTEDTNPRGGNPGEIENLQFVRLWD